MKRNYWGTISLLIAAGGWLFVRFQPWWSFSPQTFPNPLDLADALFSSALVGGLADWFAVTALFRRPLGLPLPHVDVLRRRKNDVAKAVPRFVAQLLTPELLTAELIKVDFVSLLETQWGQLQRLDLPTTLSRLLRHGLEAGWDRTAGTAAAGLLKEAVQKNRSQLSAYLTEIVRKNAGWKALFIGSDTIEKFLDTSLREVERLQNELDHPMREFLRQALALYAFELTMPTSERRNSLDKMLQEWLADEELKASGLKILAQGLEAPSENREDLNQAIGRWLGKAIERTNALEHTAQAVGDLLTKIDPDLFIQQAERAVGQDLQYIRVNGAVVGGLAGVALSLLSHLRIP